MSGDDKLKRGSNMTRVNLMRFFSDFSMIMRIFHHNMVLFLSADAGKFIKQNYLLCK